MDRVKVFTKSKLALEYAQKGFYLFPIKAGLKEPPLVSWSTESSIEPDLIKKWWQWWPDANIGIATGPSNLLILDVDTKKGKNGEKSLQALQEGFGELPKTLKAKTPTGGIHFYFKGKAGSSAGRLGPGLDIRSDGGYVVAPGSETIETDKSAEGIYEWTSGNWIEPAEAPRWLLEQAGTPREKDINRNIPPTSGWDHVEDVEFARYHLAFNAEPAIEGAGGHDRTYKVACWVREYGISESKCFDLMLEHYNPRCLPLWNCDDLKTIVKNAYTYAQKRAGSRSLLESLLYKFENENGWAHSRISDDQLSPRNGEPNGIFDSSPITRNEKETKFSPKSMAEILGQELEPMAWVWDKFIPMGGLSLLAAFMKVGKSTFFYPLAIAISRGEPFLGYPTEQGNVLILAVEEHQRDVKLRLTRFGAREEDPIFLHCGYLSNSPEKLAEICHFIQKNNISVVFIDTLSRYWGIDNENDNSEVIKRIGPLLDIAHEMNVAIVLIHHEGKQSGSDGRSIRGGSALFGAVDQAILLTKRQGGDQSQRHLKTYGRYSESPAEIVISFDILGYEWSLVGKPEDLGKEAAIQAVREALLEAKEPISVKDLIEETDFSKKQVTNALKAIEDELNRKGRGVKGDPFKYQLLDSNSFHSHPHSMGEETNSRKESDNEISYESEKEV